jgi:hypothetical protein
MARKDQLDGAALDALLLEQESPQGRGSGGEAVSAPAATKAKGRPVTGGVPIGTRPVGNPAKQPTNPPMALPVVKAPARDLIPGSAEHAAATGKPATVAQIKAARLAQIVNLHIAGYSLAEIGASIGASAQEVDRMLQEDTARYVRTQPALRTYVRNWVSERYTQLLDAVWEDATDKHGKEKLEHQDRALRILDRMAKLHGAEAPTQTEVKVEAAPEAVEQLVAALAAAQGLGYDVDVFDVVDAEIVHAAPAEARAALEVSGNAVAEPQPGDGEGLA